MNKILQKSVYIFTFVIFTSCMGPKALQRQVNRKTYEVPLVYTTPIVKDKSDKTVFIEYSTARTTMKAETQVIKHRGFYLPLILAYIWDYDMKINLGDDSSGPKVTNTIETITRKVFSRSGNFTITTDKSQADYIATIELNKAKANCEYHRGGAAVFNSMSQSESAEKSVGRLNMHVLLTQNDLVILDKEFEEKGENGFVGTTENISNIKHSAMKNLIENLVELSENNAYNIVQEINSLIK